MGIVWGIVRGAVALGVAALVVGCGTSEEVEAGPSGSTTAPPLSAASTLAGATTTTAGAATTRPAATAPPTTPPTTAAFDECRPPVKTYAPPAGVTVTLTTDKATYERTDKVQITMRVKNNGGQPVSRTWTRGTPDHDLWVASGRGVLWRWAHGDVFSGVGPTVYQPGDDETFTATWEGEVCKGDRKVLPPRFPGTFAVRGYVIDGEAGWLSNEVRITVK